MSETAKFRDEPCSACGTPRAVVSGAWLRVQRKAAGLTLREMARRLDFTAAYICDVELDRRHCTPAIRKAYEDLAGPAKKRCKNCGATSGTTDCDATGWACEMVDPVADKKL